MQNYRAPLDDMCFVIDELLQAESQLGSLPKYAELEVGPDLSSALLGEAARFAAEQLAPLRRVGDEHPATCSDGAVTLPPGFADAIRQLGAGGWLGICADTSHGGQGLPEIYGTATGEMWVTANMAIAVSSCLTIGAALAIAAHGTEQQKRAYLEKMNSGEWSGTMNLTEAGAGSDLGELTSRAVPEGDHYRIYGQKIFISWGDHDGADNIVHLVLAKLPDAPAGSAGISLFVVPKFLVNGDGTLGARNDAIPISTEHKLGIHGSPTCVMAYGDKDGAIGYLLGEPNCGLAAMFTMMNEARLKVGLQGLGIAEGAYQMAVAHARERIQGGVPIIQHADVQRMLLTMKSLTEAMRVFAYGEALTLDLADTGDPADRGAAQTRVDLMIPVIKGWLTEVGQEVASLGMQVHGGMGYIEETGAAQFYRDVRIAAIYEGTNGIQAADLVGRKLARDGGAGMEGALAAVQETVSELAAVTEPKLKSIGVKLALALAEMERSTQQLLQVWGTNKAVAMGASFDYMMQAGYLFGGWQLARSALLAHRCLQAGSEREFYRQKIATSVFYSQCILPRCAAHGAAVLGTEAGLTAYPVDWL